MGDKVLMFISWCVKFNKGYYLSVGKFLGYKMIDINSFLCSYFLFICRCFVFY